MGIADDLEKRLTQLAAERPHSEWRDLVHLTAPNLSDGFDWQNSGRALGTSGGGSGRSHVSDRSAQLYDPTAVYLADRLASGMESLTTPQSARWHGIGFDDAFAEEPTDEEEEWFDKLQNYLFRARYESTSGFALANRATIESAVKLGTGIMYVEENPNPRDRRRPVLYRHIPLHQANIGCDSRGTVNTFFWEFELTAAQAVGEYGEGVSDAVQKAASSTTDQEKKFWFVHAVFPRKDGLKETDDVSKSMFESVHYERAAKHVIRAHGFFEFPFIVSYWHRYGTKPYGTCQAAMVMATIKTLNKMAKNQLIAADQVIRPPTATHAKERAPNLNAGRNNPGMLDEQGRLLVRPIITGNPQAAEPTLETIRHQLREMMFGTLWQVLMNDTGRRTATEVLQRAQEKSDMVGPNAANHQAAMARMTDREIAILTRRGAFDKGSPLETPQSISAEGKEIGIRHTAPIDKMRRSGELEAIQIVRNEMMQTAQTHPDVLDNLDPDKLWAEAMAITDAPRRISRSEDERKKLREARVASQEQAQQMAMMAQGASAAKDGAQAMSGMAGMGGGMEALQGMAGMGGGMGGGEGQALLESLGGLEGLSGLEGREG
ncbi:MAG: hypothetical protein JKY34_09235 [Kordiimonadaceae bacterium]|nr:hypothetical protein [Kordiimonadaceae bacterium]